MSVFLWSILMAVDLVAYGVAAQAFACLNVIDYTGPGQLT
jgi:hypothetical protein